MENEERFSDDPAEHFRIENEILRMKLKAQYGDAFQMGTNGELPPEVENQFLKNVIGYEEASENAEYITVYDKLGQPVYKSADELAPEEFTPAVRHLTTLLEEKGISLDFCDGPYEDAVIYRFITEELFANKIEKEPFFGEGWNFIYEEFHPNNKAEIEKNTHEFIQHWMSRGFDEYSTELAYDFVLADGRILKREEAIGKMNIFFESFVEFKNDGYNIDDVSFEMKEEELRTDSTEFDEAKFGIAPKALDPVHMVFTARKFVLVVVDAPVFVAAQQQAVIAEPAVGVDGGFGKHLTFDDRLQLCPGAIFHHTGEDFAAAFVQADHGRLAARSAPPPAPHTPWAQIGFVNLDLTGKRPGFFRRHPYHSHPQAFINPLAGLAIDHRQLART